MFKKPHFTIWLAIPILLGLALIDTSKSIDIPLHDTYYVVSILHVAVALACILSIIGLLYWLVGNKSLVPWMTATHIVVTIVGFVACISSPLLSNPSQIPENSRYYSVDSPIPPLELFGILVFFGAQVLFLVNLGIGLVRGSKN